MSLSIEDAWKKFEAQNGRCALTGLELDWDERLGRDEHGKLRFRRGSASLDRIDSKEGYTLRNVHWVHKQINMMKMDLRLDDFQRWCRLVVEQDK